GAPLVCIDMGPLPAAPTTERAKPKINPEHAGLILLPESVTQGPPPEPVQTAPPPDPAFVAQVNSALAELGRRADRYGVVLALRTELASFASLAWVLRQANCPWFGVDLDPASVLRDAWNLD